MQWIANFAVSTTFPVLAQSLGLALTYAVYALFAVASRPEVALGRLEEVGRVLK